MNIGRSEYTRLVQQEVKLNKGKRLLTKLKKSYEKFLLIVEDEWGVGRTLEELKANPPSEEVKILLEIDEFLKE